jgi:hypothetical protein
MPSPFEAWSAGCRQECRRVAGDAAAMRSRGVLERARSRPRSGDEDLFSHDRHCGAGTRDVDRLTPVSGIRLQGVPLPPMLRLVGLLMVLAGLFGMQDLADHRTGGIGAVGHAEMSEMPMGSHSAHVGDVPTSLASHAGEPARAEVAHSYPGEEKFIAYPGRGPDPPSLFALSIQRC